MGIRFSSVVAAPVEEVFDWHRRPGAIARLTPPWQPVQVDREAESLADGRAELVLPGGVRWVAEHDPGGYDPPHQFVDILRALRRPPLPAAPAPRGVWRHRHRFESVSASRTRVIDEVRSPVPATALRPMFAYRHRQLARDLAAATRMSQLSDRKLTVAMTGSSGLVGTALRAVLTTSGHRVVRLVRHDDPDEDTRRWDPREPATDLLDGVDGVIHLAGAPIGGRFDAGHKREILQSRVGPTRMLATLAAERRVGFLICASAIGYYGPDRGDTLLPETAEPGDGFLAEVVTAWEDATDPARQAGVRTVNVRTGIVQSPAGGVLRVLRPLFGCGLGGRLGSGQQWMSWIGIDDLADIYHRAALDEDLRGPVNAVAPHPVRNAEYTAALGRVLRRPTPVPVPSLGPRILLGPEGTRELALADQRVVPAVLRDHQFRAPDLEPALRHMLGRM